MRWVLHMSIDRQVSRVWRLVDGEGWDQEVQVKS